MIKIQKAFENWLTETAPETPSVYSHDENIGFEAGYKAAKAEPVDPWPALDKKSWYTTATLIVNSIGMWSITIGMQIEKGSIMARGFNADPRRDGETRRLVNGEWVPMEERDD